jgi:hypothetical protein
MEFVGLTVDACSGKPALLQNMLLLTWHIVAHRAWSMTKHDFAPACYVPALLADVSRVQAAMTRMRTDWANLMSLEK